MNVHCAGPRAAAASLSGGNLQKFIVGRELQGTAEDAHTRRDVSRAQQEGDEMRGDPRKGTVVSGRRFILVGQFFCHPGALFDPQLRY